MRRFCQLVLAACLSVAVAVAVPASWMDVPAGGGDVIDMSFLFVSRIGRRSDSVSSRSSSRGGVLFRGGVPLFVSFLVSCRRSVRVLWIDVLVSALAFRFSFRFSSRVCVTCRRAFRVGVVLLRRFCQLVFPCRLVVAVVLFVFVPSCVSDSGVSGGGSLGRGGRRCVVDGFEAVWCGVAVCVSWERGVVAYRWAVR